MRVVFDPAKATYEQLLKNSGKGTIKGMRQGNDLGTQYRSGIYVFSNTQREMAEKSLVRFDERLSIGGFSKITTEIIDAPVLFAKTTTSNILRRFLTVTVGLEERVLNFSLDAPQH